MVETGVLPLGGSSLVIEALRSDVLPDVLRRACLLPIAPVLVAYPSSTGAQRFLLALDGYDGYATWAAGPAFTCVVVLTITSGPARGRRSTISPAFLLLSPGPNTFAPPDHDRGYLPHNTSRTLLPGQRPTASGPGQCGFPPNRVLGNSKAKKHKKKAERRSPALELHVLLDYRQDVPVRVPEKRYLRISALRDPVLCL